ncbi:MAG: hypothetical protein IT368_11430, partial [Candidatus Hydrogenedentes bacterium]|nr:hypothetical protein [Candidatus Hydrogenedentota bacterium]
EGQVVSCSSELPLEGVTVLINLETGTLAGPTQFLHTLSDGSGVIDADVTLRYGHQERWGLFERQPRDHPAVAFELVLDLEGYAPQYLRVPEGDVIEEADRYRLDIGQVCLRPSEGEGLFLYTMAHPTADLR